MLVPGSNHQLAWNPCRLECLVHDLILSLEALCLPATMQQEKRRRRKRDEVDRGSLIFPTIAALTGTKVSLVERGIGPQRVSFTIRDVERSTANRDHAARDAGRKA